MPGRHRFRLRAGNCTGFCFSNSGIAPCARRSILRLRFCGCDLNRLDGRFRTDEPRTGQQRGTEQADDGYDGHCTAAQSRGEDSLLKHGDATPDIAGPGHCQTQGGKRRRSLDRDLRERPGRYAAASPK